MANRHLSRSIAIQVLFECDFNNYKSVNLGDVINRNLREFAPGLEDREFVEKLVKGVIDKKKKLDSIIEKTAPEWPIPQIAVIDRNVLRLGLYELIFGNPKEVPPKVAINEAIELAKTFGGETSGKFVNGVLGTVYKEIGEPDKDGSSQKSKTTHEELGGAVVYKNDKYGQLFALVHDVFGYWTLSKGKLEKGEDLERGTKREIKEELGIGIEIKEKLGENEYTTIHPEKGKLIKHVTYFLAETTAKELKLEKCGGLDDARWFNKEDLLDLKIYDDLKPIFAKAIKMLESRNIKHKT